MKGGKMKTETDDEALIPLAEALRLLKSDPLFAWVSIRALRTAVQQGRVPFTRNSKAKKARYKVRLSDLKKELVT